jgi:cytochrome c oxidase subunit 2
MNENLLNLVLTTAAGPRLPEGGGTVWMPPQSSTAAPHVDEVFYFIYWVSVFFFVLIVGLMVYFIFRYRRRKEGERARSRVTHNTTLEITWSAIPLVLVVVMFYMGYRGFMDIVSPPANAMNIRVTGQKWNWFFEYPNGFITEELHVPVNVPVELTLESKDVIHSLWIPDFRIKRDAVPGRYNRVWFEATTPGETLALCAEYCGTQHSDMVARVVVHEPGEYEKWLEEASDLFGRMSPAEVGKFLYQRWCIGCHNVDGTANIGPSFKDLYGEEQVMADGSTVVAEDNYIRESILYPQRRIVRGYGKNMSSFKGLLKDREINAIIDYIRELSGVPTSGTPETQPAEPDEQDGATPADQEASAAEDG